jgi:flagellar basal-body rod modification protein FlgD
MATIGTLFPTTTATTAAAAATGSQSSSAASTASGTDSLANQTTFLQLLVAQLKNQDPTQPMDGTTFVTQLAQFSDLQENLGSRQDLDAISKQYLGTTPSSTSTTSSVSGS